MPHQPKGNANSRTLAIVAGASKELGHAFLQRLCEHGIPSVGISREKSQKVLKKAKYLQLDLTNPNAITSAFEKLQLDSYARILWVHSVGKYKFEADGIVAENDKDGDGVDDEVLHSNYSTFKHSLQTIMQLAPKTKINFLVLDSVFNELHSPQWKSFAKAKELLIDYAREEVVKRPYHLHAVHVKTTGLKTSLEPHAHVDKTLLVDPAHVVEAALPHLMQPSTLWKELRIIKNPSPKEK